LSSLSLQDKKQKTPARMRETKDDTMVEYVEGVVWCCVVVLVYGGV
jgi:hypothetical protein